MRVLLILFLVVSLSASLPMTVVFGQTTNTTTTTTTTERPPGDTMIPPNNTTVTKFVDDTGLTINYVPPGWSVIDHDNTSPEEVALEQELIRPSAVTLCPPYSKVDTSDPSSYECTEPNEGEVQVSYYPAMDKNEYFVPRATVVNPNTGLLELNLTGQNILDYTISPVWDMIVQKKTVPVNVTHSENGTSWQVQGLLVLFTNPIELKLKGMGLYFVDNTTGYDIQVHGPQWGGEEEEPDVRGDAIPIHGIGLDNLPPVMAEPMQIINSLSITRR